MPVEIRELVIRATVSPEAGKEAGNDPSGRAGQPRDDAPRRALSPAELDRIVTLCVSRVVRSIKRSQER